LICGARTHRPPTSLSSSLLHFSSSVRQLIWFLRPSPASMPIRICIKLLLRTDCRWKTHAKDKASNSRAQPRRASREQLTLAGGGNRGASVATSSSTPRIRGGDLHLRRRIPPHRHRSRPPARGFLCAVLAFSPPAVAANLTVAVVAFCDAGARRERGKPATRRPDGPRRASSRRATPNPPPRRGFVRGSFGGSSRARPRRGGEQAPADAAACRSTHGGRGSSL
jgi:hypothetical protein